MLCDACLAAEESVLEILVTSHLHPITPEAMYRLCEPYGLPLRIRIDRRKNEIKVSKRDIERDRERELRQSKTRD